MNTTKSNVMGKTKMMGGELLFLFFFSTPFSHSKKVKRPNETVKHYFQSL